MRTVPLLANWSASMPELDFTDEQRRQLREVLGLAGDADLTPDVLLAGLVRLRAEPQWPPGRRPA